MPIGFESEHGRALRIRMVIDRFSMGYESVAKATPSGQAWCNLFPVSPSLLRKGRRTRRRDPASRSHTPPYLLDSPLQGHR